MADTVESVLASSPLKQRLLSSQAAAVIAMVNAESSETTFLGVGVASETPMEAGSLTKVFTALLAARSIHRGEMTLDTRLDQLLFQQDWPGDPITVLHLATHTSGLPRLSISKPDILPNRLDPYQTYSREHLLNWLQVQRPHAPDTKQHSYSNLGYAVLGLMLERATAKTYAELLQERLLQPLGMKNTGLHLTGCPDRTSQGFKADGSRTSVWHFDGYAPCGALVSTATDMIMALQAMMQPEGLLQGEMDSAMQPLAESLHGNVGLAWVLPHGQTWGWHNGATFGYTSYLGLDRERQMGIAILCNQFLPAEINELGHKLMRVHENNHG